MTDYRRRGMRLPPTTSEREAMNVLYETLTTGAIENGKRFTEPDDDWAPVWLVVTPAGQGTLFTGNEHKHKLTQRVGAYATKVGAIAIGHLHSAWTISAEDVSRQRMLEITRQMEAHNGSTQGIAERREVLLLQLWTASAWEEHSAPILRHADRPPELAAFEPGFSSKDGSVPVGPMATPLHEALVRVG